MLLYKKIIPSIILLIGLSLITASCKKEGFDHENPMFLHNSICDSLAPLVTGEYTGVYYKMGNHTLTPDGFIYDTISSEVVTLNVSEIFPENNYIIDSLYCFFDIDTIFNGPFYMKDFSGQKFPVNGIPSYSGAFNLNLGSFQYYRSQCVLNCQSSWYAVYLPLESFVAYK
jgi:hypothetical protein